MDLTEAEKSIIRSKLTTFENYQEGLATFVQRKHEGGETLDFDSLLQTIVDQNHQLEIVKDIVVKLFEIQELDPKKETYLSRFYR